VTDDTERVRLSGPRGVRGSLDTAGGGAAVVACPPHPQMGGDRRDRRLRAVSDALTARGVACLRIDYGAYDEGVGERRDAREALAWLRDRSDRVGLFGYSFGAGVALLAGAEADPPPDALAVLAPPAASGGEATAGAVDRLDAPLAVVYGERDDTVDWGPVVERARERGATVEAVPGDHFLLGQVDAVGEAVGSFFAAVLGAD